MVQGEEIEKIEGNIELRDALPYGVLRKMSKVFGTSEGWVSMVTSGKRIGSQEILKCSTAIAALNVKHQQEIENVLKMYENDTNK